MIVKTGRWADRHRRCGLTDIARRIGAGLFHPTMFKPNGFIEPCLPSRASEPPAGSGWVHEIKHDGCRLIVRRDGAKARLFTRHGYDWTARFPAIADAARELGARTFTLDGEVVVCGPDGITVFDDLQRRLKDAFLYAFDLIEVDGEDLRRRPFSERKKRLAGLLAGRDAGIMLNERPTAGFGRHRFKTA
jgi:bifunctional non-homologous end joining protein LigD